MCQNRKSWTKTPNSKGVSTRRRDVSIRLGQSKAVSSPSRVARLNDLNSRQPGRSLSFVPKELNWVSIRTRNLGNDNLCKIMKYYVILEFLCKTEDPRELPNQKVTDALSHVELKISYRHGPIKLVK